MNRLQRLWAPAVCSSAVALVYGTLSLLGVFQLRGGRLIEAGYCLAVLAALTWFVLVLIDDALRDMTVVGRTDSRRGGQIHVGTLPISYKDAFRRFYGEFFWPMAVLAFGLGGIVTTALIGVWPDQLAELPATFYAFYSELAAGAVWLIVSCVLFATVSIWAALGFLTGFCLGIVAAQLAFNSTVVGTTLASWAVVAGLSAGVLVLLVKALRRARTSEAPAER